VHLRKKVCSEGKRSAYVRKETGGLSGIEVAGKSLPLAKGGVYKMRGRRLINSWLEWTGPLGELVYLASLRKNH